MGLRTGAPEVAGLLGRASGREPAPGHTWTQDGLKVNYRGSRSGLAAPSLRAESDGDDEKR
eukprot:3711944-Alexandrium_andersonii.AAC.1